MLYLFSGVAHKLDMATCLQQLAATWALDLRTESISNAALSRTSVCLRSGAAIWTASALRSLTLFCCPRPALVFRALPGPTFVGCLEDWKS